MKKLISFLLVLSMIASMFVAVSAEGFTGSLSTTIRSTNSATVGAISTYSASSTITTGTVNTVLSENTPHFPSVIELKYQKDTSKNGILIAAMTAYGQRSSMGCIMQSTDGGKTWSFLASPKDQLANNKAWAGNMAYIYELPAAVGNMPAGTLIYASDTVDYNWYSDVGIWKSTDCGKTWTEISIVSTGGGTGLGVWEPVMFYDNGYLYCFYSDDTGDGRYTPDQKIVYQRSRDGINWEAPVDVCSFSDPAARPGMPVITKMGNGEYFLVYEYVYPGRESMIYYKTTKDITQWKPSNYGTLVTAKSGYNNYYLATSPSCVWTSAGGNKGTLFVTGMYQLGGVPYNCIFVSYDYGMNWSIMRNPLAYSNYDTHVEGNMVGYRPIMTVGSDPSIIHYINTTSESAMQYVTIKINDDHIKYGDVNGDGVVDAKDVTKLKKYLANYNPDTGVSTETVGAGVDANGDGVVDAKDVTKLKKYLANYNPETGTSTEVLGPQ